MVTTRRSSRSSSLHRKFAAWGGAETGEPEPRKWPAEAQPTATDTRSRTKRARCSTRTHGGEVEGEARAAAKCIAHWRCPPGTPACVDPILCSLSLRSASPRPSPVPVRFLQEWVWSTASLGARVWLDWMDGWMHQLIRALGHLACGFVADAGCGVTSPRRRWERS